jgi:hypothetical protein
MFHRPRVLIPTILSSRFDPRIMVYLTGLYKLKEAPPQKRGARRNSIKAKEKPLH